MNRIVAPLALATSLVAPAFAAGSGEPGFGFCFGDGSMLTPCPCAAPNTVPSPSGGPDGGCANSFHLDGGKLSGLGTFNPDNVVLMATRLPPDSFCMFFAGTGAEPDGNPFGDGAKCVQDALFRFGGQVATGGTALYPQPDLGYFAPLHTITGTTVGGGQTVYYQVLYRNAAPRFCTPSAFNLTNGYQLPWN